MALAAALTPVNAKPGDFKSIGGQLGSLTGVQEPSKGWLLCNGAVVAQTTYQRLFNAIGPAYNIGGEGAGNFRLPDFRDRHMQFKGTVRATVGASGGGLAHSHVLESHVHSLQNHVHPYDHTHTQAHVHSGTTAGPNATTSPNAGGSGVASSTHTHNYTTDQPNFPSTGAATGGGNTGPSSDANSQPATPAASTTADAPYQAHGAVLIRY
jgi:microcystin-dependent protein